MSGIRTCGRINAAAACGATICCEGRKDYDMNTTVTMTLTQLGTLACYLRMTATFRQEERECWERLATEIGKDGKPAFPLAPDIAKIWADMERELEEILEIYDNRMTVLREIAARTTKKGGAAHGGGYSQV